MDVFPAFFPLTGRTVVIAGRGEAADAKARLFKGSPARIRRLSGEAMLNPDSYAGATLAFVADDDPAVIAPAVQAARAAGVPVNAVDNPSLCDFTAPAVIDRGEVVAAVGTGGASPMLAALLRNDIEARLPEGAGRLAALLRLFQGDIRAALPDPAARRTFLSELLNNDFARFALAGDKDAARRAMSEALAAFQLKGGARGAVCVIVAGGPTDRLSLRAARRLAQCDALFVEPGCVADVAGLARRDARRLEAGGEVVDAVLALARQGLAVVWATATDHAPPALLAALAGEAIALERLDQAAES